MNPVRTATAVAWVCLTCFMSGWLEAGQPPSGDKVAAEALFRVGLQLMEDGQFAQACPKLEESQRIDPAVGTLMYLAHCYEKTGRIATAWATYRSAEAAARNARQPERAEYAREHAEALEGSLPRITVEVPAHPDVPDLQVKRDGVAVAQPSWGIAIPVDPGRHEISAMAPGKRTWFRVISLEPASAVVVTIPSLADAPNPARIVATSPSAGRRGLPNGQSTRGEAQRLIGLVAGGVGLVGMGVGAAYGIMARSKDNESNAYCLIDHPNQCQQAGLDLNDQAKRNATYANIGLFGGGAVLAAGLAVYVTAPRTGAGAISARLSVSDKGHALAIHGRW